MAGGIDSYRNLGNNQNRLQTRKTEGCSMLRGIRRSLRLELHSSIYQMASRKAAGIHLMGVSSVHSVAIQSWMQWVGEGTRSGSSQSTDSSQLHIRSKASRSNVLRNRNIDFLHSSRIYFRVTDKALSNQVTDQLMIRQATVLVMFQTTPLMKIPATSLMILQATVLTFQMTPLMKIPATGLMCLVMGSTHNIGR